MKYGQTRSRIHTHTGRPSDFSSHPPYLFGIDCTTLIDSKEREGLGAQRYDECELVGMTANNKYILLKKATGHRITRRDIIPTGELEVALRGIPAPCVTAEVQSQTDESDLAATAPPLPPPPAPVKVVAGYEPVPDGTAIEMGFKDDKGALVFHRGSVAASHIR